MLGGKVSIITGAGTGIGAATAKIFAQNGASLVIAGRNLPNLEAVAEQCRKIQGKQPLSIQCDVTTEKDVENLVSQTVNSQGRLDILVNNAGIIERGSIESTSLDQYDRMMRVNLRSIYQLTMLCIPHLLQTKGAVVNVSSVNGMRSFPGVLAYNISKAALDQLTRCVALEVADRGVRVNSVNPGVTVTELHRRGVGLDTEAYSKFLEHSKSTHAMGRVGRPEEAAQAILYFASDMASFTTGAILPVDGGRHAMCPR